MTRFLCVACALSLITSVSTSGITRRPSQRGSEGARALARARAAIAPERKLETVHAIVAKGRRAQRNQWFGPGNKAPEFVENPIELRILLPDHFLRIEGRGLSGTVVTTGFRGNRGLDGKPAPDYEQRFVARLALAALLLTNTTVSLSLDRSSTPSTLTFTGPDSFRTDVVLDPATALPATLRWRDRRVRDGSPIDVEWTMEDRRLTGGLNLPHRMIRNTDGRRFDVLTIESWVVDPPLTAEDFVAGR